MAVNPDPDGILSSFSFDAMGDAVYESIVLIDRYGEFQPFE